MLTISGKSIPIFVTYMTVFIDLYCPVEHLLAHAEDSKVFLCFNGNILAGLLCLPEVLYEFRIKVRSSDVVLIHLFVVLEVQRLQFFYHSGI